MKIGLLTVLGRQLAFWVALIRGCRDKDTCKYLHVHTTVENTLVLLAM